MNQKLTLDEPGDYRIQIQGTLDNRWTEYFDDMVFETFTSEDGTTATVLTGRLPDQAALQGVLQKLYNLGFPLISAEKINR